METNKIKLSLKGLDCPNCAAKIERKVNDLEEVKEASLNFAVQYIAIDIKEGYDSENVKTKVKEIVKAVVNAVPCPVTVKIRSGWDKNNINAVEIAKIVEEAGASAITVHPRTRAQGYEGLADWSIIKKVKENVKRERKFFESLTSISSFNKYIDISKENIYYLAQYNYRIPNLNKYDEYAVKDIYDNLDVDDAFALISANLVVSSELKLISVRRPLKTIFLPLRKSFFDNDKNIKELKQLYKNNKLHKYIKVLINYSEASKEIVNLLNKNKLDFYLYCSRNSAATSGKIIENANNYLVSKEFYDNNKNIISKWKNLGINIIKEEFDGIVTDSRLLID